MYFPVLQKKSICHQISSSRQLLNLFVTYLYYAFDLWPRGPDLLCRGRQHPEKGSFLLREIKIEKVMEIKIEINKPPCWGTQHQ